MRHLFALLVCSALLWSQVLSACAAEPAAFEIRDGDRVLLLGDTLLERENTYGYLETRMHEQFPTRKFSVRNLSWSGETPLGWSRASFDPPAKGWELLKEQIAMVRPTVVFLGFGMAASLQEMTDRAQDPTLNPDPVRYGAEPMSAGRFKKELAQLMDAIVAISAKGQPTTAATTPATTEKSAAPPAKIEDRAKPKNVPANEAEAKAPADAAGAPKSGTPPADVQTPAAPAAVRFVLLSPIEHEDLRATRPGMPDPTAHNALLEQYSKIIEELAAVRNVPYVRLKERWINGPVLQTENGIHLNGGSYQLLSWQIIAPALGWEAPARGSETALRAAVLKKDELFFHRFRPENATYLFGFRKNEQGQNAKEIAQFDPLIEQADAEIDRLKRVAPLVNRKAEAPGAAKEVAPVAATGLVPPSLPDFTVEDGYQITLWAQNPLLEKPTQMNWDAQGRLWVCSSSLYPQIEPGQVANDKILILEDTDRDGVADKSSVFTSDLLIPTAVVPDLVSAKADPTPSPEAPNPQLSTLNPQLSTTPSACYVGQSTELLRFEDTDGDGKADVRRVVFSGFGTEDTHHLIHTLKWGPDGRLYFNQSIYIHSHLETPWGMVRLNSGGVYAYDPRTERVEVLFKGFCNPWGHAWDQWGQSFITDGAGFQGITWGIPGAQYFTYENGRRILESISPGNYPKFASLELIHSPAFPAEWQGNAITCDFRAHRIVRFGIEDLAAEEGPQIAPISADGKKPEAASPPATDNLRQSAKSAEKKSGYVTKEMPDLVRTSDQSFRPIDVRLGPDGALYVADWSNPVINHGEVDFRDPRRDHHMGRIWRIARKDAKPLNWEPLAGKTNWELLDKVLSKNDWEQQQSRFVLQTRSREEESVDEGKIIDGRQSFLIPQDRDSRYRGPVHIMINALTWAAEQGTESSRLAAMWLGAASGWAADDKMEPGWDSTASASIALRRALTSFKETTWDLSYHHAVEVPPYDPAVGREWLQTMSTILEQGAKSPHPRVRVEAMRSLANIPTTRSAELVLNAALYTGADAPGSARPSRAGSGAPGGTSTAPGEAANSATRVPGKNDAARAGNESSAGAPKTAGGAPALPGVPKNDPYYDYAAWLSINDLAKPWTDAIASGAWKADTAERGAQLAWGLKAIDPGLASATLAGLVSRNQVPLDGTGPWIELLGTSGAPKELRALFDRLAAGQLSGDAELRALKALAEAARLRNARPEGDLKSAIAVFASPKETNPARQAAGVRLLGAWKIGEAQDLMVNAAADPQSTPELRGAAFEALRNLGGAATASLTALTAPERALDIRRGAVVALAQIDLGAGLAKAAEILPAITDENAALETWRGLLNVKGAADAIAAKPPKELPKIVASAGVRAAREAGKSGAQLLAALTPLAGMSEADSKAPKDYKAMAAYVQRDGDPASGELVFRRMSLGCTTCHAIGGAGGVVGPDMTSIGASAPLDYLIESVLEPAVKVKEGYNAVTLTLKDGTQATGIQARETAQKSSSATSPARSRRSRRSKSPGARASAR